MCSRARAASCSTSRRCAPHPEQAADIANAVAEEYLKQSRERINAPAIEGADRYSSQLEELKEKVDDRRWRT